MFEVRLPLGLSGECIEIGNVLVSGSVLYRLFSFSFFFLFFFCSFFRHSFLCVSSSLIVNLHGYGSNDPVVMYHSNLHGYGSNDLSCFSVFDFPMIFTYVYLL